MGIVSPSTTPRHPHRNPTNSAPCEITPFKTAPRITALRPGQSPPLVKIPIFMCCLHTQLSVTIRAGLLSVRSNTPAGCRELKALGRVQVYCGLLLAVLGTSRWTGVSARQAWRDAVVLDTNQRMRRVQPTISCSLRPRRQDRDAPRATHDVQASRSKAAGLRRRRARNPRSMLRRPLTVYRLQARSCSRLGCLIAIQVRQCRRWCTSVLPAVASQTCHVDVSLD